METKQNYEAAILNQLVENSKQFATIQLLVEQQHQGIQLLGQEMEQQRQENEARLTKLEDTIEQNRQETEAKFAKLEAAIEQNRQETEAKFAKLEAAIEQNRQETEVRFTTLETKVDNLEALAMWMKLTIATIILGVITNVLSGPIGSLLNF